MNSLREELEALQRKLTKRLRFQAAINALIQFVCASLLLIAIDYRFRPEEILSRYLLTIFFWSSLTLIIVNYLIKVWLRKVDLVDVAFAVENTLGNKTGDIAAAIDLERQATFRQPEGATANDRFKKVLDQKIDSPITLRSRLFITKSVLVVIACLALLFWFQGSTATAFGRLGNPTNSQKWRRFTKLQVFNSSFEKVSSGSVLSQVGRESTQFYVIDEYGDPPEEVLLEIQRGSQAVKQIRLHGVKEKFNGRNDQSVYEFRLVPSPVESLKFRVTGGDDQSMTWIHLLREVKPGVVSLSCEIIPPEYLNVDPAPVQDWIGRLQVPVGSNLNIDMQLNRPVVAFQIEDEEGNVVYHSQSRSDRFSFPLQLPEDADAQILYELLVKTTNETSNEQWTRVKRLQIDPIPDLSPVVQLLQPIEELAVTSSAVIPIHATARDDYGLKSFRIVIAADEEFSLPADDVEYTQSREINGQLNIGLTNSVIGQTIRLFAEADDFNSESPLVTSPSVLVHVVSPQTKASEINTGLKSITREISNGLSQQEMIKTSTEQFQDFMQRDFRRKVAYETVNQLRLSQEHTLEHFKESGIQNQVRLLEKEIQVNEIDVPEFMSALQAIQRSIQREIVPNQSMSDQALQSIQEILQSNEESPLSRTTINQIETQVKQSIRFQAAAIQASAQLVNQLADWVDSSDLQLKWQLLKTDLRNSRKSLSDLAKETISRSLTELSTRQRNRLEQSTTLNQEFVNRVQQLQTDFSKSNNKRWEMLGRLISESEVDSALLQSTNAIRQNNLLEAIQINQRVLELFSEFESQLAQEELNSRSKLIELMKMYRQRFVQLLTQQQELNSKWIEQTDNEGFILEQTALLNSFREIQESLESLGIGQLADLFETYFNQVEVLLISSTDIQESLREQQTRKIEFTLEEIDMQLLASLQRLMERDQQRLVEELQQVVTALLERQEEAVVSIAELVKEQQETGRLSRRRRRELLEIAKLEQEINHSLSPFRSQLDQEMEIYEILNRCISLCQEVEEKFEQGKIDESDISRMQRIRDLLQQLAGTELNSENSAENPLAQISPEIQEQIKQLLERQRSLIQREKEELLKSGSLKPELEQTFIKQQQEIDEQLKRLLKTLTN